jgi:phosphatidylglycerophosphate synthase
MLDARIRAVIDPGLDRLAGQLQRLGLSANQVTIGGFALGLLAMALIATGSYMPALLAILLSRLADGLDGALARRHGITDLGGFLDIVLDFIFYSGVAFAFALADPGRNALPAAFLIFSFVGTGSSFLAFAVLAAKRRLQPPRHTAKSLYYIGGLTEGSETIAVLALFCILPAAFPQIAVVFGCLCWLTTASRVASAWRTLR